MIGRIVAWALLLAALIVVCRDLIGWYDTGHYAPVALGALWSDLAPGCQKGVQHFVQDRVAGWLWDPVITTLIEPPAWIPFAAAGVILLYLCRNWGLRPRRFRRRRRR